MRKLRNYVAAGKIPWEKVKKGGVGERPLEFENVKVDFSDLYK